jgi:hypothetical protein
MTESVRQIITTRERTPRDPRWASAWRRTLFRYLAELRRGEGRCQAPPERQERA